MKSKVVSWVWRNYYFGDWVESNEMSEEQAWKYAEALRGSHENIRVEEVKNED